MEEQKFKQSFWDWLIYGDRRLGVLYKEGRMAFRRREWRGIKSTFIDYINWLKLWGVLIAFTMRAPIPIARAFFKYRWLASYLSVPAFVDRNSMGLRGGHLTICHINFRAIISQGTIYIANLIKADKTLGKNKRLSRKMVLFDEMTMSQIMAGFPDLIGVPYQLMPVFLVSEIDQLSCIPYIDAIESFGLPSDTCPVPTSEAGAAILGAYPPCGSCFISSTMPCDGSVMASAFQERGLDIPVFPLSFPVRYRDEETLQYAVEDVKKCIEFIEKNTGAKFNWDAYFKNISRFNKENIMEQERWEVNKTPCPVVTGSSLSLFREFAYQIEGGLGKPAYKSYQKANKIMYNIHKKKTTFGRQTRFRGIVWSCPSHYYANFSTWLQCCWGITVLVDMEALNFTKQLDVQNKDEAFRDLARLYERMVMRKHTNGGYENVLPELWRMVEEFKVDIVIMYQHVACKTMVGLQGLFDEQARERGIHLIWVPHDLMDPRTVSRREMRESVNRYMQSVMQVEPLDPSLTDIEDSMTW